MFSISTLPQVASIFILQCILWLSFCSNHINSVQNRIFWVKHWYLSLLCKLIHRTIITRYYYLQLVHSLNYFMDKSTYHSCRNTWDFLYIYLEEYSQGPSINYITLKLAISDPPPPCNPFGQNSDWLKLEENPIVTLGQSPPPPSALHNLWTDLHC